MTDKHEELLKQVNDAKMVHMNSQAVFPLLNKKVEETLAAMCSEFQQHGTVKIAHVAYITACRDLVTEFKALANRGERAAKALNLNPEQ